MKSQKWRVWDKFSRYGELLYRRATGELEEMESSKAVCTVLSDYYRKGMSVLDVGCGAGHYLRSLRLRLDKDIDYTGIDATENYINLAKKAFGNSAKFKIGDICDLPLESCSYDIVMSNNVIHHLPPSPEKAISELVRVSKEYIFIRTVFGKRNYFIKEIHMLDEITGPERDGMSEYDLVAEESEISHYNYFNLYTVDYLRAVVNRIDPGLQVEFIDDNYWKPFDNTGLTNIAGTKVVNGLQVTGNILLDWKFVVIKK